MNIQLNSHCNPSAYPTSRFCFVCLFFWRKKVETNMQQRKEVFFSSFWSSAHPVSRVPSRDVCGGIPREVSPSSSTSSPSPSRSHLKFIFSPLLSSLLSSSLSAFPSLLSFSLFCYVPLFYVSKTLMSNTFYVKKKTPKEILIYQQIMSKTFCEAFFI